MDHPNPLITRQKWSVRVKFDPLHIEMDHSADSLAACNFEKIISKVELVDSCKIAVITEMDDSTTHKQGENLKKVTPK